MTAALACCQHARENTQSNSNVAALGSDWKRVALFEMNATRQLAMSAKSNSSDVVGMCSLAWPSHNIARVVILVVSVVYVMRQTDTACVNFGI